MPDKLQLPSVGRMVHFFTDTDVVCAALIVFVSSVEESSRAEREDGMPLVNLVYFDPDGHRHTKLAAEFSTVYKKNHWSWPPRV